MADMCLSSSKNISPMRAGIVFIEPISISARTDSVVFDSSKKSIEIGSLKKIASSRRSFLSRPNFLRDLKQLSMFIRPTGNSEKNPRIGDLDEISFFERNKVEDIRIIL